ncbi:MAG: transporter substrate-binding domain-containing protein [Alphaproteobacteria bacterium]|nr:transporter substrate-binding domain-containing protein [Alphaproteobacteria bacterium]
MFVVFALACTSADAKCEPDRAKEKYPRAASGVVKIAATTTTPPFSYADPADLTRLTGIEVELIELAMQCAGLKYDFVKGPFSTLIQTVMSGATDVMIGNVNYRPERAEKVDFIVYMRSGQSVIVRRGNPKGLRSLDDLCGATASSTVGGVSAAEVERQSAGCVGRGKPAVTYIPAVDQEAAIRQLVNGRIDFVMDGSISAKMRAESREGESLELGFTILTELVIGLVVRKGNEEVRNAVLEGMQTLESEGKLKALVEKYRLTEFGLPVELRR